MRRALPILLLLCGAGRAWAEPPSGLDFGLPVAVASVIDGRTAALADGTVVRLSGLDIPAGRWQATARGVLDLLLQGRSVQLAPVTAMPDRHGRVPGRLRREDGAGMAEELLRRGLARVDAAGADPAAVLAALLAVEGTARAQGRGLWADPAFAVRAADGLGRDALDRFQIIEGRVLQAALVRGRVYLNFGTDRRQDFTVTAEPAIVARLAAAGQDLLPLQGRRVRVRGWLDWFGGPRIAIERMEQIERLD